MHHRLIPCRLNLNPSSVPIFPKGSTEIPKFCLRGQGVWTLVGRYLSGTIAFPSESICLYTMPDTPDKYFPWRNSSGVRNVPKVTIMPVDRDYSRKPRRVVSAAQGETTFDRSCERTFVRFFHRQSASFSWGNFNVFKKYWNIWNIFQSFRKVSKVFVWLSSSLIIVIIKRGQMWIFYEFI